ncbi:hypothetical protein C8A01DRAFT_20291 [Parachaetomium inaequale]|uniref:rhomboid protease n=1 Tax=Parachaetomium inaequale TaxID=2588326 RepID=A0AAN6P8A7_9PEZI|nr:hypothetical protein C8A01DRAFT_20291 [Parachaetomium inaequale]
MPNNPTHMLKLSLQRVVAYIDRLPLFTRLVVVLMLACEAVGLLPWWDIKAWGWLEPELIGLSTMYRTNTFPLIHKNVLHLLINLLSVTPMLEGFEAEHGTITSLALFFGALSTLPALIYVGIERLLGMNTPIMGASIWGFLLIGSEAIRRHKISPYLVIREQPTIPTWTVPIAMLLVAAVLMPSSSVLGHVCGLGVGYTFGLGYLKFLAPPDWALRWIEGKLKLRVWLPYYVSVDQKTYGRFGVIPMANLSTAPVISPGLTGSSQRLGPTPE